jgi:hypothetical protein
LFAASAVLALCAIAAPLSPRAAQTDHPALTIFHADSQNG